MFNLKKAIRQWKSNLRKNPSFEDGDIAELESHLLEQVQQLKAQGLTEDEAFEKASEEIGEPESLGQEMYKTRTTKVDATPSWKQSSWVPSLLPNFIKITFRNASRNKGYAFINVLGLAVGMACCILILMFIKDELSYDQFHKKADQIYRVNTDFKWGDREGIGSSTGPPIGGILRDEIPEIQSYVRVFDPDKQVVRNGETFFSEDKIFGVDSTFFNIFSYKLLEGDPDLVLDKPNSVVLTKEMARKYFGDENPVGKSLEMGLDRSVYMVTGIMGDPPSNTHIKFDMIASISSYQAVKYFDWSWVWSQVVTYVQLTKDASVANVEQKISTAVQKHAPAAFNRIGFSFKEIIDNGGRWDYQLQPLTSIWLHSKEIGNRLGPISDANYIYILGTVAVFLLVIACINFMNLATARSAKRAREVGVRKTLGSSRRSLILQFLYESMFYTFIASLLALILVTAFLPQFNELAQKNLSLLDHFSTFNIIIFAGFVVFIGVLAGSYPALYLTKFNPSSVLKGNIKTGSGSRGLRNVLVVSQFAISIILIISTLIVFNQLDYLRNKDLGFNSENLLVIRNGENLGNQMEIFQEQAEKIPGVEAVTLTNSYPPEIGFTDMYQPQSNANIKDLQITSILTDQEFLKTYEIELIAGSNFVENRAIDSMSVILNQEAIEAFGWTPHEALGKILNYPGGDNQKFKVIGVINNFNYESLQFRVEPFAIFHRFSQSYDINRNYVTARISGGDIQSTLDEFTKIWESFVPDIPFEYFFLDNQFDALYRAQERLGKIFGIFTVIAIAIACMGLLGLITFIAEQRTKEIGIRKVMGASVQNIILLLSGDFAKLVGIAFLLACPVTYYMMNEWLQDFAYRTSISPALFLVGGFTALIIVMITISFQSIKTALINPVNSLKSE